MQRETSWTQIRDAAAGDREHRETFVRQYTPVLRAYFGTRWPDRRRRDDVEDAIQEVFVDCFRDGGALERVERRRQGGFRAYLYGVARIVAQRAERERGRRREVGGDALEHVEADEETLSRAFDRAWALQLAQEAVQRFRDRAARGSEEARLQVEVLRLRFDEGLPVREMAPRLGMDAEQLHRVYAKARVAFRDVLLGVMAERCGGRSEELERECRDLLPLIG